MSKRKILFSIFMSLVVFHATAALAENKFDPYASVRGYAGMHHSDVNDQKDADLDYGLLTTSRLGAKFQTGAINGQVEMGLSSAKAVLRLAFISYDMGVAKLTVGQTYTPYFWPNTATAIEDPNGIGFGAAYDGRLFQVRFDFLEGAYLTFIKQSKPTVNNYAIDSFMPKVSLGYDYKTKGLVAGLGGVMNMVQIDDDTAADLDGEKILSWMAYAHTRANLGNFFVFANVTYGINTGDMGIYAFAPAGGVSHLKAPLANTIVLNGTELEDTKVLTGYINAGYKVLPNVQLAAGVGYAQAENDTYAETDKQIEYFADVTYHIEKNFFIVPSFEYRDFLKGKDGVDQGTEFYYGIKFQADI